MLKGYKYAAYPNPSQKELLAKTFGCVRVVYNKYVETNKTTGKAVGFNQACKDLVSLKSELEWLREVSDRALQQSLKDANRAVRNHFKNPRHFKLPAFKQRSNAQSFRITGEGSFRVRKLNDKWSEVVLPKMEPLKFRTERALPSKPTSVTVSKTPSGKYYVSFAVEVETKPLKPVEKVVGVDLGLTDYAITMDTKGKSSRITNPRYYRNSEAKLARLQQAHSRKEKGSANWEKARIKVARQHEKVANQRKDHLYKLALSLIGENQAVITESLVVKNMMKNHSLAKSIMDASWGLFLIILSAKCAELGRTHIQLDRFFPSSKTCSNCGALKDSLDLSERTWTCEHCGVTHDRDINAAINLLIVGLQELAAGRAESLNASLNGGTTLQDLTLTS